MTNPQIPSEGDALTMARLREQATREVLQVISQSRDDEQPVFEVILENAARLCNVPIAGLQLVNQEGTHFRIASQWGVNHDSFATGEEMAIDGPTVHAQAIREARTIQIKDLADTVLYTSGHSGRVKLVDVEGIRTVLVVPLIGFEGRYDYTASGTAVNLGSRLCDKVKDGEILLSPRAATAVEDIANLEPAGDLTLKRFHAPVVVSRVTGLKDTT